ncbi:MAG: threonylcarbamoyl-AMP synthase [Verrucomicrobiales bacterium]|nr:threonylcarbamoyl-AMP synthase [Verrucomicrobiales bacterium]
MLTELHTTESEATTREAVNRAVSTLHAGEPVALPTETVYGLAADALNETAVKRVFEAKERPSFDPLIVHVPDKKSIRDVAEIPDDLDKIVTQLVETFWPGPLTIVLPKKPHIPDEVTAGLPTVGVRMSNHPIFGKVIKAFGGPLAAPSANRFGRVSPTSAAAVMDELDGRIPLVIDGGACARGIESTIVALEENEPKPLIRILRLGPVTADDLKKFGKIDKSRRNEAVEENAPEAPGMLASHYAPNTPLRMPESAAEFVPEPGKRYALLSYRGQEKDGFLDLVDWEEIAILSPGSGRLPEAGIRLYHVLRQLDQLGVDEIIAEPFPDRGVGSAILDRLKKAASIR